MDPYKRDASPKSCDEVLLSARFHFRTIFGEGRFRRLLV